MNESHGGISDESSTDVEEAPLYRSSPYSWSNPPDIVLLQVFQYLSAKDLLTAGESCRTWSRVSKDECLWKRLFHQKFKVPPLLISTRSYLEEYKRLTYHVPSVQTEVLTEHNDIVRHVSFSHNGKYFATCSSDGYVKVWKSSYPASIEYCYNTKTLGWAQPIFSEFNHSDTMLAVTGSFYEMYLQRYEDAFFSLEDGFPVKYKDRKKSSSLLGTWYNDWYFLSGHIPRTCIIPFDAVIHLHDLSLDPVKLRRLYQYTQYIRGIIKRIIIASPPILPTTERFSAIKNYCMYGLEEKATNESSPSVSRKQTSSKNIGSVEPEYRFLAGRNTKSMLKKEKIENELSKQSSAEQDNLKKDMKIDNSKATASGKLLIFSTAPGQNKCYSITFVIIPIEAVEIFTSKEQERQYCEPIIKENFLQYIKNFDEEILSMVLSPDHRYLFVKLKRRHSNSEDPLEDSINPTGIHVCVIDLETLEDTGVRYDYCTPPTPNENQYRDNIFLDACDQYVTSGFQNYAYIWDTHYTSCLKMLPHDDAVTAVSFNPCDSETLVTVSQDSTVRVWRSRNRVNNLGLNKHSQ